MGDGPMDGWMDGLTDRWTHPLIESLACDYKCGNLLLVASWPSLFYLIWIALIVLKELPKLVNMLDQGLQNS